MLNNTIILNSGSMGLNCGNKKIKLINLESSDPNCDAEQKFLSLCDNKYMCNLDVLCPNTKLTYTCVDDIDKDLLGKETDQVEVNQEIKNELEINKNEKKDTIKLEQGSMIMIKANDEDMKQDILSEDMQEVIPEDKQEVISEQEIMPEYGSLVSSHHELTWFQQFWRGSKDCMTYTGVALFIFIIVFLVIFFLLF